MKYKYSVDSNNKLIIESLKTKAKVAASGIFSIDKNNRLIYWLNEPASWRRQYNLPNKISFKGSWKLNSNYDLELVLDETPQQYECDQLIIKGKIITTDRDALVFEVKSIDKQDQVHIQLLKLGGFWQADKYNRINFIVQKKVSAGILTLNGIWQINQNQQIIYTYEKTDLKTKTKTSHTLTFEGFWQINNANKLTYIISQSSESRFDFRVQLESPNLYPKEGVIKYRSGIGLRKKRLSRTKIICLYGTWKFSRKLGLIFQMDYGQSKIQAIEFGTNINLTKKNEIVFSLTNKRKEPLGIIVTFTHRFLKQRDAETFLRLRKLQKESGIEAGMHIPF